MASPGSLLARRRVTFGTSTGHFWHVDGSFWHVDGSHLACRQSFWHVLGTDPAVFGPECNGDFTNVHMSMMQALLDLCLLHFTDLCVSSNL